MDESHELPAFKKLKQNDGAMSEDTHYSLLYEGVPDEFKTYAETELKETPKNLEKGMRKLKQFVEGQNLGEIEETTLRAILRCCKYDVKKSLSKLEKFLQTRRTVFEKVANMDTKAIEAILEDQCGGFLPYRDKHGRVILFTRPSSTLESYFEDLCALSFPVILYMLRFPMTSMLGVVYFAESKFPSVSTEYKILKRYHHLLGYYLNLPVRTRKVHVINENVMVHWLMRIIRPLLPSKMIQRISFHGSDLKSLQKYYHPDILPEEFGGSMGPLDTKFYRKEILDFIKKIKSEHGRNNISEN